MEEARDSSFIDGKKVLPLWMKNKVYALKNLQLKHLDLENKFFEDLQSLERKYMTMYQPLYDERRKIINGEREPTEEESKWNYEDENVYKGDEKTEAKGLPGFWLEIFKTSPQLGTLIAEHDEPILEHLRDIKIISSDQKPLGYTLEFHFDENEYFTDKVLTKTYEILGEKDEKRPFLISSNILYKIRGCDINWKEDKDVTVKMTKTKQKGKTSGQTRTVNKEEKQDSFFNFFKTPNEDGIKPSIKKLLNKDEKKEEKSLNEDNEEEMSDEIDDLFDIDFNIGQVLKEDIVPKAVLFYTGELNDDFDMDDEFDLDDDDEDDEDDDEDDDDDVEEEDDKVNKRKKLKGPSK